MEAGTGPLCARALQLLAYASPVPARVLSLVFCRRLAFGLHAQLRRVSQPH